MVSGGPFRLTPCPSYTALDLLEAVLLFQDNRMLERSSEMSLLSYIMRLATFQRILVLVVVVWVFLMDFLKWETTPKRRVRAPRCRWEWVVSSRALLLPRITESWNHTW